MKKAIFASLLGIAMVGNGLAQDHPEHPKKRPAPPPKESAAGEVIEAVVTGQNFCLGCSLKKEFAAAAQCSQYGHRHALKVTAATAAGREIPEMKGWVLHYLDTDNGQPFIKEHHGETLTLTGRVYRGVRVLEVEEQESANKTEHPEHPRRTEHPEHPK